MGGRDLGVVRGRDVDDGDVPTGATHPSHFPSRAQGIRKMVHRDATGHQIKGLVRVGQVFSLSLLKDHVPKDVSSSLLAPCV